MFMCVGGLEDLEMKGSKGGGGIQETRASPLGYNYSQGSVRICEEEVLGLFSYA